MSVGLSLVPRATVAQTAAHFASDQEVRWCPGCGDYAVLAAFKQLLPTLGIPRENLVFISGIGCSSRFPYYLNTYGIHSVHGRAPTLATGLALTRPDLSVWVITGDGDGLSIGGNHLIHALRRNLNLKIVLFNNAIYGLTKGQYSPTSPLGTITKSSPLGSADHPLSPTGLALAAGATFVGRAVDLDRPGLTAVLQAAAEHRGAALIEILQDCPVFNEGALESVRGEEGRARLLQLKHGTPLMFGSADTQQKLARNGFAVRTVPAADRVGALRHDETDLGLAHALTRLPPPPDGPVITGVIRRVTLPTYDDAVRAQSGTAHPTTDDLQDLLDGPDFWNVAAHESRSRGGHP